MGNALLRNRTVKFSPQLPDWKNQSIRKLGFGLLNKVSTSVTINSDSPKCVLLFPQVFWDSTVDYFGQVIYSNELPLIHRLANLMMQEENFIFFGICTEFWASLCLSHFWRENLHIMPNVNQILNLLTESCLYFAR
jgi:hypothetical protein